jgi:hypothetical protein
LSPACCNNRRIFISSKTTLRQRIPRKKVPLFSNADYAVSYVHSVQYRYARIAKDKVDVSDQWKVTSSDADADLLGGSASGILPVGSGFDPISEVINCGDRIRTNMDRICDTVKQGLFVLG